MTKDEMISKYLVESYEHDYLEAQELIKNEMKKGNRELYLYTGRYSPDSYGVVVGQLIDDGFTIDHNCDYDEIHITW